MRMGKMMLLFNMKQITENMKAVIIGLYRQGNSYKDISKLTGVNIRDVGEIVKLHLDKIKNEE